jgi:hypothetical protein
MGGLGWRLIGDMTDQHMDGRAVVGYSPDEGVFIMFWSRNYFGSRGEWVHQGNINSVARPTHWMSANPPEPAE